MEVKPHCRIAYTDHDRDDVDVIIRKDIEQFNFILANEDDRPGQVMGVMGGLGYYFQITKENGLYDYDVEDFFREEGGVLYPKFQMRVFMATTRPDIAVSDCLFYFIPETGRKAQGKPS